MKKDKTLKDYEFERRELEEKYAGLFDYQITDTIRNELSMLQEHDNCQCKENSESLADVITFLTTNIDDLSEEAKLEVQEMITSLSYIRRTFKRLRKP